MKTTVVVVGLCAMAVAHAHDAALSAASGAAVGSQRGLTRTSIGHSAPPTRKPVIRGIADKSRAWLGAEHRGLTVSKVADRSTGSIAIELRFRKDLIAIGVDARGGVSVTRAGSTVCLTSPESYERLQQILAGSDAAFATRVLLAEREATSDLKAAEMSLLSVAAFAASLMGDVDAPRRLATRHVEKHGGQYRPVRSETCFEEYTSEVSDAWNDMQACMAEANQDESMFQRAYRRVACNAVWLLRGESAWIEYVGCLGLGQLIPD
jgi:hypothetical protein